MSLLIIRARHWAHSPVSDTGAEGVIAGGAGYLVFHSYPLSKEQLLQGQKEEEEDEDKEVPQTV